MVELMNWYSLLILRSNMRLWFIIIFRCLFNAMPLLLLIYISFSFLCTITITTSNNYTLLKLSVLHCKFDLFSMQNCSRHMQDKLSFEAYIWCLFLFWVLFPSFLFAYLTPLIFNIFFGYWEFLCHHSSILLNG